jgi:hypothetical protein
LIFIVLLDDGFNETLIPRGIPDTGDAGIGLDKDKGKAAPIAGVTRIAQQAGEPPGQLDCPDVGDLHESNCLLM